MAKSITLRRVGGSVGTTLPKEMVDRLDLAAGDRVLAVETETGILLTPYTEELEAELATLDSLRCPDPAAHRSQDTPNPDESPD